MNAETLSQFRTLLDAPSPAVLTTYRKDGSAVGSPVWFHATDTDLEVVIAQGDVKLRQLEARPVCSLLVFEAVPPFRGIRVEGEPIIRTEGATAVRSAIARRYLGREAGEQFTASRGPGAVVSMPLNTARSWDLSKILPE